MGGLTSRLWTRRVRVALVAAGATSILISAIPPGAWAATIVPSGPGTVVIGPQAMEGNLQIHPGDTIKAGYDFTMPGSHPAATVTVQNASVKVLVKCSNGTAVGPIAISFAAQAYSDPAGSPSWYPSGDQSSTLVYQASVTAPDLCAGGVMSAASGALFQASFISTDIVDPVNVRFHYSDNTSGSWSGTLRTTPSPIAKTYTSAKLTPALSLTLSADKSSAIPGDTITYSGTVTNTGAALVLSGDFFANGTGTATTTVAGYWDEFATSVGSGQWTPFAGVANAQAGYTMLAAAPIATGMTLAATSVPSPNVTYPSSGDPLLGTTIAAGSSAQWHYQATLPLTPAQVNFLLDPTKVTHVRNSLHLEVTPTIGTPATVDIDFTDFFLGASPPPSGAATGVSVTIQPPAGAAPISITSGTVPALSSLAPGAAASYSATFKVPAVAAKGPTESDSAYLARLALFDGSSLSAIATASGGSTGGTVNSPQASTATTEHLPVLTITKTGPPTADAGTTAAYPLSLKNSGSATASGLAITDTLPGGATGQVLGIPASLAGGAMGSAQATYAIPSGQAPGSLSDTAAVSWQDANASAYGPVSSAYTTSINNSLVGATISLSPSSAGPILTGNAQALQATLLNRFSVPVANRSVSFTVAGVNPTTGTATTDANGVAVFSYTGANVGSDVVQASVPSTSPGLQSNTATVSWVALTRPVSTSPVQGNFYFGNYYFVTINPSYTPAFGQTFPNIAFNPPPDAIPNNISGLGVYSHPFTDVTTDVNGNYSGTIVAQGNGHTAGAGDMYGFQASFTGTFNVAAAGNVAFQIHSAGGMIFGIGGGATRVSGQMYGAPSAMPFQGYPVMGARNKDFPVGVTTAVVNFPTAGSYPYEVDYTDCCGQDTLTMRAVAYAADPTGLSVYTSYAETHPGGPGGGVLPTPWQGSPNTNFMGVLGPFSWDNGAVRIDNPSTSAVTLDDVSVDVGTKHFDQWGTNLTVPAGGSLIVTQMADQSMDTSDINVPSCTLYATIPIVHVKLNGVVRNYPDMSQVINTGGSDIANCGFANESQPWTPVSFSPVDVGPIAPSATIALTPATVEGDTVGQTQVFTAAAMDSTGRPIPNLPVTLSVFGPNGGQVNGTTDAGGLVNLSYVGINAGTDNVQVTATIAGARTVSNVTVVSWTTPPGPSPGSPGPAPPSITGQSPADGSTITKPVAISATLTPPAGQSITSWSVAYQDLAPSSQPVILATGAGTAPTPLATFDPTLLPNDVYAVTITATASGGGTQVLTTSVVVAGNLKLGRYITTYQDLTIPVSGFQMQVRRVYDSFDKHMGDFGIGWHLELANFRVTVNRQLGAGGWTQYDKYCAVLLCITGFKTSTPHFVTVVFPDGHEEIFDFTPTGGTNVFLGGGAAFTARPGSTSSLQALGDTSLNYTFDGNLYSSNGTPYNPTRFKLTTHSGRVLVLDTAAGLISETDPNGNSLSIDSAGVHASTGSSLLFTRDTAGRITGITGPGGQNLVYSYTAAGDLGNYMDANGNASTFSYDSSHDLLTVTGPGATKPLRTLRYDASGRLTDVIDGDGGDTRLSMSLASNQQIITDPLGDLTTINTFDNLGELARVDRISGGKTLTSTFTYDTAGDVLSITDPLGHITSATYDSVGNMTSLTDGAGNTSRYASDSFGGVTAVMGPDGTLLVSLTYDLAGNVLTVTDRGGNKTIYTYGSAGHLATRTDADLRTTSYTFGANGLVNSASTAGAVAQYLSDSSGRVTAVTDANGNTITLAYDANGNVVSRTDATQKTRSWSYDAFGRLQSVTDPLGKSSTINYDAAGRIVALTDRNGITVTRTYDADGRLLTASAPDGSSASFTYDGFGRQVSASTPSDVLSFAWDDASHLIAQATSGAQPANTLSYGYDSGGRETSVTGPEGTSRYSYNLLSDLSSLTDSAGGVFSFGYDAALRLTTLQRPNGVTDSNTYDAAGQLLSRTSSNGATTLTSNAYTYSSAGQRVSRVDTQNASNYQFDPISQLLSVTNSLSSVQAEAYTYDLAGNRISSGSTALSYDGAGRLVRNGTTSYLYDLEGQRTSMTDGTGLVTRYTWNAFHQLTQITPPNGPAIQYRYDALGRRVEVDAGSTVTHFTYDKKTLHLQYAGNSLSATYTYMPDTNAPLEVRQGSSAFYYLSDAQASTIGLTDQGGGLVATQRYDSFGRPLASTGAISTPLTYIGQQYDANTGLYFLNARYYDPEAGSFLKEDPLPYVNAYSYAFNDPVDASDPSGADAMVEYEVTLERNIVAFNNFTEPTTEWVIQGPLRYTVQQIIRTAADPLAAGGDTGTSLALLLKIILVTIANGQLTWAAAGIVGLAVLLIAVIVFVLVCSAVQIDAPPATPAAPGDQVSAPNQGTGICPPIPPEFG